MNEVAITKPCEYCGGLVTKTASQQRNRTYWSCGRACSSALRMKRGNTPSTWGMNPFRGEKETRACAVCGKDVTNYLSHRANARIDWCCSIQCATKLRTRKRIEAGTWVRPTKPRRGNMFPCKSCGKEFYRNKNETDRGKSFCSKPCADSAMRKTPVVKECPACGVMFERKPSQAARIYCSRRCENSHFKRPIDRVHNGRQARYNEQGYVLVWEPDHPNKTQKGWQLEHRVVVEVSIGRYLASKEHIHHRNGVKDDNRIENLEILSAREHSKITLANMALISKHEKAQLAEYRRMFGDLPTPAA